MHLRHGASNKKGPLWTWNKPGWVPAGAVGRSRSGLVCISPGSERDMELGPSDDGHHPLPSADPSACSSSEVLDEGADDESVKLFIGQVPRDLDEDALRPIFETFGPIVELTVIREKQNGSHRGCAFLTYSTRAAAEMAVEQLHNKHKLANVRDPPRIRKRARAAAREFDLTRGVRAPLLAGAKPAAGETGRRQIDGCVSACRPRHSRPSPSSPHTSSPLPARKRTQAVHRHAPQSGGRGCGARRFPALWRDHRGARGR